MNGDAVREMLVKGMADAEYFEDFYEMEFNLEMFDRSRRLLDLSRSDGYFICDEAMFGQFVSAMWMVVGRISYDRDC